MHCWRTSVLFCLGAALRWVAAAPDSGHQDVIDPTNGTSTYGEIVNATRLVLNLELSNYTEDGPWGGVDANLIYDLSIVDPPYESSQGGGPAVVLWTPKLDFNGHARRVMFWEPGPNIGWTPFTEHMHLEVEAGTSIDTYLSRYAHFQDLWEGHVGMVDATSLENDYGWNITRVCYMNGLVFARGPAEPPGANVSVAAVYVMETEERPYEFVWWELVPLTLAMARDGDGWFWNQDVPKALEKRLLGELEIKVDLK